LPTFPLTAIFFSQELIRPLIDESITVTKPSASVYAQIRDALDGILAFEAPGISEARRKEGRHLAKKIQRLIGDPETKLAVVITVRFLLRFSYLRRLSNGRKEASPFVFFDRFFCVAAPISAAERNTGNLPGHFLVVTSTPIRFPAKKPCYSDCEMHQAQQHLQINETCSDKSVHYPVSITDVFFPYHHLKRTPICLLILIS